MFLELIAVFMAGFAGAGVMMLLSWLSGRRLPRWIVPLGAGAAMLIAGIASEYSWYNRTVQNLPDGLTVAQKIDSRAAWRPWTYIYPLTDRFVAADTGSPLKNAEQENLYLVNLYFYGRWRTNQIVQVMVDCKDMRRADPVLGDGSPPLWRDVGAKDPIVKTVCAEV
ncbi:hypothetical protein [Mameliella sediminis]|uniref:hypothetical protein n=1 Tax=Mameliella sediminis TaxID=2836866 RepID=UPI001C476DAD|nr:hypothetical protein [Mameliella sediminis]MBY6116057.1 hypothetical protein [Antarctobacter heliothermus]MBY6146022.1 hypothetical protein [Mameliella alba]MBV7396984.1 hypothetical protein [Mameliella sediminis]MBY6161727.1 hypothetical protein [Mameliella alba]MBY6170197.1 hypothetical protein [Mameliella alba]